MSKTIATALLLLCIAAPGHGLATMPASTAGVTPDTVPLYTNLGTHHYRITTTNPLTQQYFDQGLRLTYAFNHAEAIRAFQEGARLDPRCAMCHWGVALAHGPNINAPMSEEAGREAHAAVLRAQALADGGTPLERALIEALATRYSDDAGASRPALDSAYAAAMGSVAQRFPDDSEAATLYAEALMDLRPWSYWTRDRQPEPGTTEILANLERVIERNPEHPGACHFYIHAVEAAYPERAVDCAERLADLMPGAGHLVHMPAHIYIRVGRWNDAIRHNEHAVHVDEQYIADQRPLGIYPLAYYPHNYHFLAFAATMAGRSGQAIAAARDMVDRVDVEVARESWELQALLPYHHLTLLTFGRWSDVLAAPSPSSDLPFAHAMTEYARGMAHAATGAADRARRSLVELERARDATVEEPARSVLEIASHSLMGELDLRAGRDEPAIAHLREALRLEDELIYMEPPFWHSPVRHMLGAALLEAGRAAEAEALYREDLERFPENGWALQGLTLSLQAQGREEDAREVERRFAAAWSNADVTIRGSRF
jgi:tetratricopeptide (TPR) repeat protein